MMEVQVKISCNDFRVLQGLNDTGKNPAMKHGDILHVSVQPLNGEYVRGKRIFTPQRRKFFQAMPANATPIYSP